MCLDLISMNVLAISYDLDTVRNHSRISCYNSNLISCAELQIGFAVSLLFVASINF